MSFSDLSHRKRISIRTTIVFSNRSFFITLTAVSLLESDFHDRVHGFVFFAVLREYTNSFFYAKNEWIFLGSVAFGILAILVKVTTFAAFVVCGFFLIAHFTYTNKAKLTDRAIWKVIVKTLLTIVIPLIIFIVWLKYSDNLKSQNLVGNYLTSKNLSEWNYGTFDQRISHALWLNTIWKRVFPEAIGGIIGVVVSIIGFFLATRRIRICILILLTLFLFPFFVFTNLHMIHNYYQYSTSFLLVTATALAIYAISIRASLWVFTVSCGVVAFSQLMEFNSTYLPSFNRVSQEEAKVVLGRYIKDHTQSDEAIVSLGSDWSSILPYYSERKTLALPLFLKQADLLELLDHTSAHLGGLRIGAVVLDAGGISGYSIAKNDLLNRFQQAIKNPKSVENIGAYRIYFIKREDPILHL